MCGGAASAAGECVKLDRAGWHVCSKGGAGGCEVVLHNELPACCCRYRAWGKWGVGQVGFGGVHGEGCWHPPADCLAALVDAVLQRTVGVFGWGLFLAGS